MQKPAWLKLKPAEGGRNPAYLSLNVIKIKSWNQIAVFFF